jgi:hypothetical protein
MKRMLVMLLLVSLSSGLAMPQDGIEKVVLSKEDAQALLVMAEMYFAQKQSLATVTADLELIRVDLDLALMKLGAADKNLGVALAQNASLQNQLREVERAGEQAIKAERRRRYRHTLYGVCGGLLAGLLLGFIAR